MMREMRFMKDITKKEFIQILENLLNKNVRIKTNGLISFGFVVEKFEFTIKDDIIYFIDVSSNNYINFSLNIINHIETDYKTIICVLDDNMETKIVIK